MSPSQALRALLDAMPRCSRCNIRIGVLATEDRWWLCETCWDDVPHSHYRPARDIRIEVTNAFRALVDPA